VVLGIAHVSDGRHLEAGNGARKPRKCMSSMQLLHRSFSDLTDLTESENSVPEMSLSGVAAADLIRDAALRHGQGSKPTFR
jgi:hypothetical protein